jgi:hypothetical protein
VDKDDPYDGLGYDAWRVRANHRWRKIYAVWLLAFLAWTTVLVIVLLLMIH